MQNRLLSWEELLPVDEKEMEEPSDEKQTYEAGSKRGRSSDQSETGKAKRRSTANGVGPPLVDQSRSLGDATAGGRGLEGNGRLNEQEKALAAFRHRVPRFLVADGSLSAPSGHHCWRPRLRLDWESRKVSVKRAVDRGQESCDVCFNDNSEEDNLLVVCDGCNVAAHQECYGIAVVPEGDWFCENCRLLGHGVGRICDLCGIRGGAMRPLECGGWGHSSCAMWHPRVELEGENMNSISLKKVAVVNEEVDGELLGADELFRRRGKKEEEKKKMKGKEGNDENMTLREFLRQEMQLTQWYGSPRCRICGGDEGIKTRCFRRGCRHSFHVECAKRAKLRWQVVEWHDGTFSFRIECDGCASWSLPSGVARLRIRTGEDVVIGQWVGTLPSPTVADTTEGDGEPDRWGQVEVRAAVAPGVVAPLRTVMRDGVVYGCWRDPVDVGSRLLVDWSTVPASKSDVTTRDSSVVVSEGNRPRVDVDAVWDIRRDAQPPPEVAKALAQSAAFALLPWISNDIGGAIQRFRHDWVAFRSASAGATPAEAVLHIPLHNPPDDLRGIVPDIVGVRGMVRSVKTIRMPIAMPSLVVPSSELAEHQPCLWLPPDALYFPVQFLGGWDAIRSNRTLLRRALRSAIDWANRFSPSNARLSLERSQMLSRLETSFLHLYHREMANFETALQPLGGWRPHRSPLLRLYLRSLRTPTAQELFGQRLGASVVLRNAATRASEWSWHPKWCVRGPNAAEGITAVKAGWNFEPVVASLPQHTWLLERARVALQNPPRVFPPLPGTKPARIRTQGLYPSPEMPQPKSYPSTPQDQESRPNYKEDSDDDGMEAFLPVSPYASMSAADDDGHSQRRDGSPMSLLLNEADRSSFDPLYLSVREAAWKSKVILQESNSENAMVRWIPPPLLAKRSVSESNVLVADGRMAIGCAVPRSPKIRLRRRRDTTKDEYDIVAEHSLSDLAGSVAMLESLALGIAQLGSANGVFRPPVVPTGEDRCQLPLSRGRPTIIDGIRPLQFAPALSPRDRTPRVSEAAATGYLRKGSSSSSSSSPPPSSDPSKAPPSSSTAERRTLRTKGVELSERLVPLSRFGEFCATKYAASIPPLDAEDVFTEAAAIHRDTADIDGATLVACLQSRTFEPFMHSQGHKADIKLDLASIESAAEFHRSAVLKHEQNRFPRPSSRNSRRQPTYKTNSSKKRSSSTLPNPSRPRSAQSDEIIVIDDDDDDDEEEEEEDDDIFEEIPPTPPAEALRPGTMPRTLEGVSAEVLETDKSTLSRYIMALGEIPEETAKDMVKSDDGLTVVYRRGAIMNGRNVFLHSSKRLERSDWARRLQKLQEKVTK